MHTQDVRREHLLDLVEPIRGGYELPGVDARKPVKGQTVSPALAPIYFLTMYLLVIFLRKLSLIFPPLEQITSIWPRKQNRCGSEP